LVIKEIWRKVVKLMEEGRILPSSMVVRDLEKKLMSFRQNRKRREEMQVYGVYRRDVNIYHHYGPHNYQIMYIQYIDNVLLVY